MLTALSALNPFVLLLDREGRALRWSRSFQSHGSRPPGILRGTRALSTFFADNDVAELERVLGDAVKRGETEHRSWLGGGHQAPICWTALTIRSPAGETELVVVTGVDSEGDAELPPIDSHEGLLDDTPFEMWAFDRGTYEILAVNETAARDHGYRRDELRSRRVLDLWVWSETPRLVEVVTDLVAREPTERFGRHLRRDGTVFDIESYAVAGESVGRPVGIVLSQTARPT